MSELAIRDTMPVLTLDEFKKVCSSINEHLKSCNMTNHDRISQYLETTKGFKRVIVYRPVVGEDHHFGISIRDNWRLLNKVRL